MRCCIRAAASLVLVLWPVAFARADGAHGMGELAVIGTAVVVGALALALALGLGGIWLVRHRRRQADPSRHDEMSPRN